MKQNYFIKAERSILKVCVAMLFIFFGSILNTKAQVRKDFKQRTSISTPEKKIYNVHGDFAIIGNTNMTLYSYDDNKNNSLNTMIKVDKDNVASTKNSSSAELLFSNENNASDECSEVIYAGLYWTARTNDENSIGAKRKIKLKGPKDSSYQEFTAGSSDIQFPGDNNMYVGYAEVTDLVKNNGSGEYWVADMELSEGNGGSTGYYGGWGMVVIYENAQMNLRDITVFDGYAYVRGQVTQNYEIPVSGFNTAQSGPINMKLGLMAGEGDRGISGDYFEIQKLNGSWLRLNHSNATSNNFFNSSISTTGTRNPNLLNNTGLDINVLNIPNEDKSVIKNNQTSTKFRYGSTQDTYVIYNMVMSVDAYQPNIEGVSSLTSINSNNSPNASTEALPGDVISYKVQVKNKGNEPIKNAKLVIPVPYNVSYIQNSANKNIYFSPTPSPNSVTYDPSLGATGSIVWNIGTLPVSSNTNTVLGDLTLKFKITEDCTILKNSICGDGNNVAFRGSLSGIGDITNIAVNDKDLIQGYTDNTVCEGKPITEPLKTKINAKTFIETHCQNTPDKRVFNYCNRENPISVTEVNSAFPTGTRFYNSYPVVENTVEYTINNPFPKTTGTNNYFAIVPGSQDCYIAFDIVVDTVTSIPTTEDVEYCINSEAKALSATPSKDGYNLYYYTSINSTSPQTSLTPSTDVAGEFTYYVAEGPSASCISTNRVEIKVKISKTPLADSPESVERCDSYKLPALTNGGYFAKEDGVQPIAVGTEITKTQTIFVYTAANGSCEAAQNSFKVTINDTPVAQSLEDEKACDSFTLIALNEGNHYFTQTGGEGTELFAGDKITLTQTIFIYVESGNEVKCSDETSFKVTINPTPEAPVVSSTVNTTCNLDNGSITITEIEGIEFSIDGENYLTNGQFNNLAPNTYYITARYVDGDCISSSTKVEIKAIPDTEAPELSEMKDIKVDSDARVCGAIVAFEAPTATDNCEGTVVTLNEGSMTSGSEFPVGTTTVTYTAKDAAGNTSTVSFDVIVIDNEVPTIVCPSDIVTTNTLGQDYAVVTYEEITANDNCSVTIKRTSGYASGEQFPIGTTVVTHVATDASGNKTECSFTVLVKGTPIAIDDSASTDEDTPVTISVLNNDSDPDGDELSIIDFTEPSNGTVVLNQDGTFTYTPNNNFNGTDSFEYTISDGNGGTDTATVTITVVGVNDAPVAVDDDTSTDEDTAVTISVLNNDSDPDGDELSIIDFTEPSNGTVILNEDGTFTYTPNNNFNGTDSFEYTISDGNGGTDTATVTITVGGVNDAPVAVDDSASTDEDTAVTISVLNNDSDPDGDELSIIDFTEPSNGTVILNEDGTFTYTPNNNFNGTDSFEYTISDGNGGTDTATVTITVVGVNDAPVAVDDSASTDEDTAVTISVLNNDSDPDGDELSIIDFTEPSNGTVILNEDGTFTYTPNNNFNGTDSFEYTISDGNGGTDTAPVTITVVGVNDAPVAVDDSASTDEDTAVTISVLNNDSDPDGDELSIIDFTEPSNGTVILNEDGTFTYTPNNNFNGTDSFEYTISDGNGGTDTATVTITVGGVNDAPVAVDDSASTDEDTAVTISVLNNDSDPDGDELSIIDFTEPSNGTVVLNEDGTFTYTPNNNFNGVDSFEYTISDGNGGTDTATVTITVVGVNDAPVAVDDAASTDEDTAVTISVLNNDSDPDGDELSIIDFTEPSNGTVVLNEDGTFTYTPNNNFNGVDSFEYTISDGNGGTDTATVTITVVGVNDAPVAVDDSASTDEDTEVTISVLNNDSDPDGDVLTVISNTNPSNGTVVFNEDGTFTYTPNNNFNGTDSFEYTISDGNGGTDTATVTITVGGVNDAPVAVDDSASTDEDIAVTISVLNNDSDPDGDVLTVISNTNPSNGMVVLNQDGTFTYTPNNNFNGVDSFEYTISDGNGGTDTATVTITVGGVNDAPVAVDDSASTDEDTAVTISVLNNDSDPDGDELSIIDFTEPSNGTVILDQDGTFTYTPNNNFNGVDSFEYTISDGNGGTDNATVTITVGGVNDAPVAVDDSASTDEDTSVTISVLNNDSDPDGDVLTVISNTNPSNGTVVLNEDGTFTYTPNNNFNGVDSFEYTISDGNGGTDTATVTITVVGVNDAPVAVDDSASTDEDTAVTISVLDNDSDPDGDELSIIDFTEPSNGTVVLNDDGTFTYTPNNNFNGVDSFEYTISDGNGGTDTATVTITVVGVNDAPVAVDDAASTDEDTAVTISVLNNDTDPDGDELSIIDFTEPSNGSVVLNQDGTFTYTPNNNFNGTDSFEYTISDGNGGTDTATVTITVNSENDAPVAVDDSASTDEDTEVTISVLNNDSDPDGDALTVVSTTTPSNGTVVINDNGTITYTPNENFNGKDSFEYTISDGNGGTDTATVTITVVGVNDAPVAVDDAASTDEDTAVTISVLNNDSDPDGDALTVVSTTTPSNGTVVINDNGTITYTPNENFNGKDSFEYTISDGNGGTDTATVTITIGGVNDAPVAVDDAASTDEDTAVTISVLDNDSDVDGNGLTVISVTPPSNGTVVINDNGTITYTPNENFNGTDSFDYTVSDGNGGTDTATVTITVNPVNELPPVKPVITSVVQPTCALPTGTITVETIAGLTYGINGVDYQESEVFASLEPGTYSITSKDEQGQVSEETIVILDTPSAQVIETLTVDLCIEDVEFNLFELLVGDYDTTGQWSDPNNTGALFGNSIDPSKLDVGTYTFNYETSGACGSITEVTVFINNDCIVLPCGQSDIKDSISKVVTPNGDQKNDRFTIGQDLDCGFSYNVKIFNRWGAEVYSMKNYQNNWDGFSNKSVTSSNQLPSGTYYYIVEVNEGGLEPIQGYIYLGTK